MARPPVERIRATSALIRRLHRWRLSQGLGRTRAALVLSNQLPIPINRRNLDVWEQGIHEPDCGKAVLIDQFLLSHGF